MNLLHVATNKQWDTIYKEGANEEDRSSADNLFESHLMDVLRSENLIVLAGLGTSLCVKKDGVKIAPTMGDLWYAARESKPDEFDEVIDLVRFAPENPKDAENIEALLSQCQVAQNFNKCAKVGEFVARTEKMVVDKCRFVDGDTVLDIHKSFLMKVARRSTRLPRMRLFTTNYDLCFETAANRSRFVVVDGFSHTFPQEFDGTYFSYDIVRRGQNRDTPDYIPNIFHLYKLHGSLDWEEHKLETIKKDKPKRSHIIYPRYSKYESSYSQPFLEMMSQFQMALRQPGTGLIVVGFGFNDQHIAQPLRQAIHTNVNIKGLIVDPFIETSTNQFHLELKSLINNGDWRFALLNAGFEDFVPKIPDLIAKTEDEQHRERLRQIPSSI